MQADRTLFSIGVTLVSMFLGATCLLAGGLKVATFVEQQLRSNEAAANACFSGAGITLRSRLGSNFYYLTPASLPSAPLFSAVYAIECQMKSSPMVEEPAIHLGAWPELEYATLSWKGKAPSILREIEPLSKLRYMCLKDTSVVCDNIKAIAECQSLQQMSFSNCRFTDDCSDGFRSLTQLRKLSDLEIIWEPYDSEIKMSRSLIESDDQKHLSDGLRSVQWDEFSCLKHVDLGGCGVDGEVLDGIAKCSTIVSLCIDGLRADEGNFTQLARMKSLHSLFANDTNISEAALEKIVSESAVRYISVERCNRVSQPFIESLSGQFRHRGLKITNQDSRSMSLTNS